MLHHCLLIFILLCSSVRGSRKKSIVCEGDSIELKCGRTEILNIVSANYGRTDGDTCKTGPINSTQCYSQTSMKIISERCNSKQSCNIIARTDEFGESCPGSVKYLHIVHECHDTEEGNKRQSIVCERDSVFLNCDGNKVLNIVSANYGRMDGVTCLQGPIQTTHCYSPTSMKIITEKCNGKQSCSLEAVNHIFGTYCDWTWKYLDVVHECHDPEKASREQSIICEDDGITLNCDGDKILNIVSANYGRTDGNICKNGPIVSTQCFSPTSMKILSERCNGKQTCTLEATNEVFGDHCAGTKKYLTVVHECNDPERVTKKQSTVCENDAISLRCNGDKVLNIISANYGRTDGETCLQGPIKTTQCFSSSSLKLISTWCNGKQSCNILAANSVFGDPCGWTLKYLTIVHECHDPDRGSRKKSIVCEGDSIELKCERTEILNIVSANYGRTDGDTCKTGPINSTQCYSQTSMKIISERCNSKQSCNIIARTDEFGESCPGSVKYLDIVHECHDPEQGNKRQSIVCERDLVFLNCDGNKVLNIVSANYGRMDGVTCLQGPIQTTQCYSPTSMKLITEKCNGKQSCSLEAVNHIFGTYCDWTWKYLDVLHECHDPEKASRKQSIICEDDGITLNCDGDKILNIVSANYGRTDGNICKNGPIVSTQCFSPTSMKILSERCNGKQTCALEATNEVFGDHCAGTKKYLTVVHECHDPERVTKKQSTVCENDAVSLSCDGDKVLNIISANYGRTDGETCLQGPVKTTQCFSPVSMKIISERCSGKQSCNILGANTVFGDPCGWTVKYLSIVHECHDPERGSRRQNIICENDSTLLRCDGDKILNIVSANYGRTDGYTCKTGPIRSTQCFSPTSMNIITERCNGKQSCTLQAVNGVFGDHCDGTWKYLDVIYECHDPERATKKQSIACERDSIKLTCDGDKVLNIFSANYGRTDRHSCRIGPIKTTQCFSPRSMSIITERCNSKQSCTISAFDEVFGDHCQGTFKYLDVIHECHDPELVSRKRNIACDRDSVTLRCDGEKTLNIVNANYGRMDSYTCKTGPIKTTQCFSPTSMNVISERCNNQKSCSIGAFNHIFGDHCDGTWKYLDIVHECHDPEKGSRKRNIICENDSITLKCDGNKILNIFTANYGRTDIYSCRTGPIRTTQCYSPTSMNILSERCNSKQSCSIAAVNNIFGDHCDGTWKYLDVVHECHDPERVSRKRNIVCERDTVKLKCDGEKVLNIVTANYGRTDGYNCKTGTIKSTQCFSPSSMSIITERCNGKQDCSISALNEIFGDHCDGTWKYLDVVHECHDPELVSRKQNIVCERDAAKLSCGGGKILHIVTANYGRTNGYSCKTGPIRTTKCFSPTSMTSISERCNNKESCTIQAFNEIFGDHCDGTWKYLDVVHECHDPEKGSKKQSIVCENDSTLLRCDGGKILNIVSANYGRTDGKTCKQGPIASTQCYSPTSMSIISERCNNKETCKISATNEGFGGDPCEGTWKYLDVVHECKDSEQGSRNKHLVCENDSVMLSCDGRKVLNIVSANYGRTDGTTCKTGPITTTQCFSQHSMNITTGRCNGKQRCTILVSNDIFGNPCAGTSKYLDIIHECIDPDTKSQNIVCENDSIRLNCEGGRLLNIVSANYGRTDMTTCKQGPVETKQCFSSQSMTIISQRCNSKETCTISASNKIFGDSCPRTWKYLDIIHECIDPEQGSMIQNIVCESDSILLSCEQNKTLFITKANYGRTDRTTCKQGLALSTQCFSQESKSIISRRCNGKRTCNVSADSRLFGDPCPGTSKYLDIVYKCR